MGRMSVNIYEHSRGPHWWRSTGRRVLGVYRWNGGYIRNFPLYLFGYPLRQRFLELGGLTQPKFGTVVELSSVLDKFVFVF